MRSSSLSVEGCNVALRHGQAIAEYQQPCPYGPEGLYVVLGLCWQERAMMLCRSQARPTFVSHSAEGQRQGQKAALQLSSWRCCVYLNVADTLLSCRQLLPGVSFCSSCPGSFLPRACQLSPAQQAAAFQHAACFDVLSCAWPVRWSNRQVKAASSASGHSELVRSTAAHT